MSAAGTGVHGKVLNPRWHGTLPSVGIAMEDVTWQRSSQARCWWRREAAPRP